ncbi:MAG TPA: TonB-dependent receptor [Thermoanaerobaculales bacterium]|mgnify:CR=1 FL=1|nr:TonB-dependent receptor [Thermoanaerobaculales bacterium]HPA79201.1 TonB-dependent receptor [Thermoanaerobaculales bacterium]HQL29130.1 TonB-dependent receptor [Thermoanaerobaculales bacterium]HQN95052.1 TonB-dependent receptor [Thermoanaerobaculales bacterium]HQP42240.1 TonB-dependent receptor [Thermoanaerobaculales bacterium]
MSSLGRITWVVALALALASTAAAQQQAEQQPAVGADPSEVVQEPPSEAEAAEVVEEGGARVFKDRIVVTASRQEEASADIPAPITVIDRKMIEQAQPEKIADLFKEIPGVEIDGEGPFRGLPVIRGLSSNRVLVLVDGQRLNNGRESTSFAGIQPGLVNLSEVERIEVLRGPASVQYGSDAIGGVINIITRAPDLGAAEFEVNGDVSYGYGTAADAQQAAAYVSGSGKGFAFQVGASYQEAGDYTAADGAHTDSRYVDYTREDDSVPNSGMDQTSFDGSLRFLTGDQGIFRVNAESVRTNDIGFPGFDPETSGVNILFPNFDRDKLGLAWNSGPLWGLSDVALSTYYQKVDKESVRDIIVPGFSSETFTESVVDSLGFNAQGVADLSRHRLTFGLDFYRDAVDDEALSQICYGPYCMDPTTEVAVPESHQTGLGAYLQDKIRAGDRLTIHAGLRGDTFAFKSENDPDYRGEPFDVTDSDISGNLGVNFAVTPNVDLTALVARGFRSPNLQERSFQGISTLPNTYIVQNPDLESERSLNYEAGFKVRYDRYFGGFTVFYNDITDFISFEFIGQDPNTGQDLARFANIEQAEIWGIEFDLETLFAAHWSAFLNYAYLEGTNQITDEPLPTIPPQKIVVGLRYQRASWWAEASARIVDREDELPPDDPFFETGYPGFTVYGVSGGYDFRFGLGLLAAVENPTDKLYSEPFNNRPEPGQNLRVSARYRF